jgi:hypothetical protein
MGVHLASNWPDLLQKDISKAYMDQYPVLPTMVPDLFGIDSSDAAFEKTTQVGPVPDHQEFTGRIGVVERTQGYDKTAVFTEYAAQIQIQRKLAADDQTRTVAMFGKGLAVSANRSREKAGANVFNLGFTYEPTDGDGTELFASDHPSPVSGVSTQSNEGTLNLSAANVETVRQRMLGFYDMIGELIPIDPDMILCYKDNEETAWEIINSTGKVNTADNNKNFHQGKYKLAVWNRLVAENWVMVDSSMLKDYLVWYNREPIQFMQDKDSDTLNKIGAFGSDTEMKRDEIAGNSLELQLLIAEAEAIANSNNVEDSTISREAE